MENLIRGILSCKKVQELSLVRQYKVVRAYESGPTFSIFCKVAGLSGLAKSAFERELLESDRTASNTFKIYVYVIGIELNRPGKQMMREFDAHIVERNYNPCYDRVVEPVHPDIDGFIGPMHDGRFHIAENGDKLKIMDRYETQRVYDLLSS